MHKRRRSSPVDAPHCPARTEVAQSPTRRKNNASRASTALPGEEFRVCPSFGEYEVSSLGRVRRGERLLTRFYRCRGYHVALRHPRHQAVRVSSLVAETFLGLPSQSLCRTDFRIIHRDGDPLNCRAVNLLIVPRRKHGKIDLERARKLKADGLSQAFVQKITHVSRQALQKHKRRREKE